MVAERGAGKAPKTKTFSPSPEKTATSDSSQKMGRPPLPEDQRRETLLRVAVTTEERSRFQDAARRAGTTVSTWLRQIALKASAEDHDSP